MGKLANDAQQLSGFLQQPFCSPAYMIFEVCLKYFICEDSEESCSMPGYFKARFSNILQLLKLLELQRPLIFTKYGASLLSTSVM